MQERHHNRDHWARDFSRECSCGNPIRRGVVCDTCRSALSNEAYWQPVGMTPVRPHRPSWSGVRVG